MTDLVYADDDTIHIASKELTIGLPYPVTVAGVKYIIVSPKEGVIDFYKLEKEGEE
jgi:hypothetical protein